LKGGLGKKRFGRSETPGKSPETERKWGEKTGEF